MREVSFSSLASNCSGLVTSEEELKKDGDDILYYIKIANGYLSRSNFGTFFHFSMKTVQLQDDGPHFQNVTSGSVSSGCIAGACETTVSSPLE